MKKTLKLTALLMLFAALVLAVPKSASAGNYDKFLVKEGIATIDKWLYIAGYDTGTHPAFLDVKGITNVKVNSSNKTVCKVTLEKSSDDTKYIKMDMGRPGKTVITVEYDYNKKHYTTKAHIKAAAFTNPFKSLSFGGKNYKNVFNKNVVAFNGHYYYGYKKITGKKAAKITMQSGYKLIENQSNYQAKQGKTAPAFKNGRKINFSNIDYIHLAYKDKEGYIGMGVFCNSNR